MTRTTPRGKPFTTKIDAVLFDRRSLSMNRGACLLPVSAQAVLHGIRALAIEHDKQPEPTGNTMVLDSQRDGLEATRCAAINALGTVAVQVRDDALGINKLVMKRGANDAPAVVADTQRVADFPSLCDNGFTAIPSDPSINEKGEVAFQGNLRRLTTTTRPNAQTPEQRRSPGVELGRRMYGELSAEMPGMLGATTVRAEAQVIRLACIYAALDMTNMISQVHLKAALAVWQYCEAPVRYIFGKHTGDPVADRIMEALEAHEELVLTAISQVVGRLALASVVLVSLDADEAGQKAAAWELETLGRRDRRWRPYWDDANPMLQAGVDSRAWVLEGLEGDARWSDDRREQWAERAAIMEIYRTLARHDGERQAFEQLGGA